MLRVRIDPKLPQHGVLWYGPYESWRWNQILDFARIGSQYGVPREVWFERHRMRRYEHGKRTYPYKLSEERRQQERLLFTGKTEYRRDVTAKPYRTPHLPSVRRVRQLADYAMMTSWR